MFGENINLLVIGRNVFDQECLVDDLLSKKENVQLCVFSFGMENMIVRESHNVLIITIQDKSEGKHFEFCNKGLKQKYLSCCICHTHILCFSTESCHQDFFSWTTKRLSLYSNIHKSLMYIFYHPGSNPNLHQRRH